MMIHFAKILLAAAMTVVPSDAAWRIGEKQRRTSELVLPEKVKATGTPETETILAEKAKSLKQATFGKFDPERDDPWWPGLYPTSFGDDLMINIALDNFPDEMAINVNAVLSPASETERQSTGKKPKAQPSTLVTRSFGAKALETKQVGDAEYSSLALDDLDTRGSLYRIEFIDLAGDGICCNYGNGWITITDRDRNVLWSTVGDYTFVASVYIELDQFGNYAVDAATHGLGVAGNATAPTSPTFGTPTSPTPPPVSAPVSSPVSPPVSAPTSSCSLCPSGSVGLPFKSFELTDGTLLTCGDIEDVYDSLTDDECVEFAEGGATETYQLFCECPGFEPECQLCPGGGSVGEPGKEIELEGGDIINCRQIENSFLRFTESECEESAAAGTIEAFADFCEC